MANQTGTYKLTKPTADEFYDIEVQNANMDKIDAGMRQNAGAIQAVQADIATQRDDIATATAGVQQNAASITALQADISTQGKSIKAVATQAQQNADDIDTLEAAAICYATCTTSGATQAKSAVVAAGHFALKTGQSVRVKFTNAQTYSGQPTLNVNSTGAKSIVSNGTTVGTQYLWAAGEVVDFVYDGTYWVMVDGALATTSYYGVTKLSTSTTSTATTVAATPSAVKSALDQAKTYADSAVSGAFPNCKFVTGSYTGTGDCGADNPCTLTFDGKPQIVFIDTGELELYNGIPVYYITFRGASCFQTKTYNAKNILTWGDKSVSWYAYYSSTASTNAKYATPQAQFNTSGQVYQYMAICTEE